MGRKPGEIDPTSSCYLPLANSTHNPGQERRREKWETEAEIVYHCICSSKGFVVVAAAAGGVWVWGFVFCFGFEAWVVSSDLDIREGWE